MSVEVSLRSRRTLSLRKIMAVGEVSAPPEVDGRGRGHACSEVVGSATEALDAGELGIREDGARKQPDAVVEEGVGETGRLSGGIGLEEALDGHG